MPSERTVPLDPSLFGASPAGTVVPAKSVATAPAAGNKPHITGKDVLGKGDDVWYRHRSGVWMEGRVIHVELSLDPPSYQVCCQLRAAQRGQGIQTCSCDLRLL